MSRCAALFALAAIGALAAIPASGQVVHRQAVSVLPIHAIAGFYAGDYERAISTTSTLGLGASYFSLGDEEEGDRFTYATTELKYRYYPGAVPMRGYSFGGTAGLTRLTGDFTDEAGRTKEAAVAFGFGIELARSWLLGPDQAFYTAVGGGLKRLYLLNTEDSGAQLVLPTFRISVGRAF